MSKEFLETCEGELMGVEEYDEPLWGGERHTGMAIHEESSQSTARRA